MKNGGRIDAAIQVLDDILNRHQPVKSAMRDWGKRARYAGAKDRAWVSGLVLDALRHRNSLAHALGSDTPRALILGALRFAWDWDLRDIETSLKDEHAPAALSAEEREGLLMAPDTTAPSHIRGDYPEWLTPHLERVFGDDLIMETQAMSHRAPVDLRVNTLKADAEKAGKAVKTAGGHPSEILINGYHIPAPDPSQRETSLQTIPAYSKGWVEVQDAGSQIAACAANVQPGDNVLDCCAGGGGKTLALAAMLDGKGQVYAYDIDGRRLSALIPRLKRSGAHNVQLCHPREPESLEALKGRMDIVFVDAPCTGTGTWRRKPDTKWRLKESALAKRNEEQDEILRTVVDYVKPGGKIVYATCSFLAEEDEDRVDAFLKDHDTFKQMDAAQSAIDSGQLTEKGADIVRKGQLPGGAVRLTPLKAGTDGFFFTVLKKAGN
ncbi:MAG: MFS transporter [Ponticaulis sp.]|nr:MFS transporter [Ponticaulis sp.]